MLERRHNDGGELLSETCRRPLQKSVCGMKCWKADLLLCYAKAEYTNAELF
ncbi:hypothetical protein M3J09_002566 [Ascochyta lentis]